MGMNTFFKYIDYFAAPSRVSDNLTHMSLVSKFWEIGKQYSVASVLYCSIYHCTSFEKNEIEKFGILFFDYLFIRDFRIIPEGENMSIQCK